jgi:hypothetical protein
MIKIFNLQYYAIPEWPAQSRESYNGTSTGNVLQAEPAVHEGLQVASLTGGMTS